MCACHVISHNSLTYRELKKIDYEFNEIRNQSMIAANYYANALSMANNKTFKKKWQRFLRDIFFIWIDRRKIKKYT